MLTATLHVVALHSGTFEPNSFQILDPTIWLRRNWSQTHLFPRFRFPWTKDSHSIDPPGQMVPIKFGPHGQMVPKTLVP